MKKIRKPKMKQEISYWESMVDLMSALILVLLLVFMLVLLYLVRLPDKDYKDFYSGEYDTEADAAYRPDDDHDSDHDFEERPEEHEEDHEAGGGGGDGEDEPGHEEEDKYEYEYPGIVDDVDKCAIHVTLVDGETEKTIQVKGIEFQLFQGSYLQVLQTYYPELVQFQKYETAAGGTFYLPEKIPMGVYRFHELNEPEGYDAADDTAFLVDQSLDWPEPMEITITLYPSRNVIRVQLLDRESKQPVSGAGFDIIAKEDIYTLDGTLRYAEQEIVEHLITDANGTAESTELYLGNYEIIQTEAPLYYVQNTKPYDVKLGKKNGKSSSQKELVCDKTKVVYQVSDEGRPELAVAAAQYQLSWDDNGKKTRRISADENGELLLTDLLKETEYSLTEITPAEGYVKDENVYFFKVDATGLVEEKATMEYDITSRMIRIRIGARDRIMKHLVSDENIALYDSTDKLIKTWTTTAAEERIEGIQPGVYYLVNGRNGQRTPVTVENTAAEQAFSIEVWSMGSVMAIVGIFLLVIILVSVVVFVKKKK